MTIDVKQRSVAAPRNHRTGRARLALVAVGLLLWAVLGPADAGAVEVSFSSSFSAQALGEGTTATSTVRIVGSEYGGRPAPLTNLTLRLPEGVEGSRSAFADCEVSTLEVAGLNACPPGSLAGPEGRVSLEVAFGAEVVDEEASIQPVFGLGENLYVLLQGHSPVDLELIMKGTYGTATQPYGRVLSLTVPSITTVPGAPHASITSFTISLGAFSAGGRVPSVTAPAQCPSAGFPWSAGVTVENQPPVEVLYRGPCLPAEAPPILGARQAIQTVAGEVTVRRPGTSEFVSLSHAGTIPDGSEVEALNGRARLTTASFTPGQTESAEVFGGRMLINQSPDSATTRLTLSQPLAGCTAASGSGVGVLAAKLASTSKAKARHLWVSEHGGSWGTDGRYVSTTVEGTRWLTLDECDRSLVKVTAGRVRVHDLINHTTRTVTAGSSYTATVRRGRK